MFYLFATLVFVVFVQGMSETDDQCNPKAPCGCSRLPFKGKIVGGTAALNYTWTISMRNETNHHFCGGTILNEWYIITAAHCFDEMREPLKTTVCAGQKNMSDTCQLRKIQNVIIHPSYKKALFENDIALIQMKVPFNLSDKSIARICLPIGIYDKDYPEIGTNVLAVGWGANKSGQWANVLQQVTIQVLGENDDYCDHEMEYNHTIKLCAGAPEKDTCDGDSGGPLMILTKSKRWELIGITSYGHREGCASKYPGVYTRVTAFLTWIRQFINGTSSEFSDPNFKIVPLSNGDHYEGQFQGRKMHGKGTLYYANEDTYIGNWIQGKKTGRGEFIWKNGDRYKGEFKDNQMHGIGTYTYVNGGTYKGSWVANKRTGFGKYIWSSGQQYEGEFKDGKLHGKGNMTYPDGKIIAGTWLINRIVT